MRFLKDPDATLDFGFDWSDWLARGETITDSQWGVDTGINLELSENTTKATKVWLSGGTVGETYEAVNRVTTSAGRIDDRTLSVRVRER